MSTALDILLLTTCWAHVVLAPYTKVEESFNLHATHDVLAYGVLPDALQHYDHFVFSGAVPRTFIGSVLLAWISTPVIYIANWYGVINSKADLQIYVRLVLATLNAITLCLIRRATSRRYGGAASVLFTLFTCTQFHLPFWIGRTLPNMFAIFPVNIASYLLLNRASNAQKFSPKGVHRAIKLLIFTAVVFRSEVALLLAPILLQSWLSGRTTLGDIIKVGLVSGLKSIALTTIVDSYFWQSWPLWPELHGIYFNVLQGKSSEWGISPWHTYFSAMLPKLLLSSFPLSLIGLLIDSRIRSLLFPAITFVGLLSVLGHKEWRFIVYVVPLFNVAAAKAAAYLISQKKSKIFGRLCFLVVAGMLAANSFLSLISTTSSMANYPGGAALVKFNELFADREHVHVHISNLAAQTGASLFLQTHAPPYLTQIGIHPPPKSHNWVYNKTENLTQLDITNTKDFTHVIAEVGDDAAGFALQQWDVVEAVEGFERWVPNLDLLKGASIWELLQMVKSDKLVILERK
ncbi:hypothetical protein QCA50_002485 [Cerrena zonata]|uniref:Mannosyltransferase n=1 Tax=Cerrena zonata TaxID=2478898 RepID=A0AAW0GPZ9_9APHY